MNNHHGIIIFGANGSGKTTLGRELARILGFKHMDHEDYAFAPSEIPYAIERYREEQVSLMLADIVKSRGFVLSAVTGDFGERITAMYDLAVFLETPLEIRLERVKQRAYEQHGDRIREGGDMAESHLKFVDFVATRSLVPIEQWAGTLPCPVVRMDGTEDYKATAVRIAQTY